MEEIYRTPSTTSPGPNEPSRSMLEPRCFAVGTSTEWGGGEEAASELNRAAELDPANPEPRSYLAEIARKQSELGSHPSR
jgi:hypothetical protein